MKFSLHFADYSTHLKVTEKYDIPKKFNPRVETRTITFKNGHTAQVGDTYVDLNSLEDLIELMNLTKHDIIVGKETYGTHSLLIYDDYIE